MVRPTDESKAGILPEQELNPLLNPLLGAHMGRWAEVYFTTPPDKRAQAVSDLVRELANNPGYNAEFPSASNNQAGRREAYKTQSEARFPHSTTASEVSRAGISDLRIGDESPAEKRVCQSCGHENAAEQNFCGMCGLPMAIPEQDPVGQNAGETWQTHNARFGKEADGELESTAGPAPLANYPPRNSHWFPPEERVEEFSVLSGYESEGASHSYRIYIGVVVGVLLGLLIYMTWRSNAAFWSSTGAPAALPQAVPAQKAETPPAGTPAAGSAQPNVKENVAKENSASENAAAESAPSAVASREPNAAPQPVERAPRSHRRSNDRRSSGRQIAHAAPASVNPDSSAAESQNGSEELALAERYLNAGHGNARDSRQAAVLLWKAVSKQNATATLLLSDLYLRGDGVAKDCDQARLLLDAAARKGAAGAGQRLRNLQAFGCR